MAIAAVPAYLGDDFSGAAPGHRFGMYLRLWGDKLLAEGGDRKARALSEVLHLNESDRQALAALRARQAALAQPLSVAGQLMSIEACSVAPFATGLGNEHPLENGFAFLNPHGLPYLAGSGVKGVLRRAAEELALHYIEDEQGGGWTLPAVWTLFGFESWTGPRGAAPYDWAGPVSVSREQIASYLSGIFAAGTKEHKKLRADVLDADDPLRALMSQRNLHVTGALNFWDVIPQLAGDTLKVEIMTPHQGHYFQSGESPHESGSLNPINFLAVPPGSEFSFNVRCNVPLLRRTAPDLALESHWQTLIRSALVHAFEWLGFGAKTSVGYGAMRVDEKAELARKYEQEQMQVQARIQREAAAREAELQKLDPVDRKFEQVRDAAGKDVGQQIVKLVQALAGGTFAGDEIPKAARKLKEMMIAAKVWKELSNKPDKDKPHKRTLQVMEWLQD